MQNAVDGAPRPPRTAHVAKRVVIVDDSRAIRNWLRAVLAADHRLEVVGEADCADAARRVIRETQPDVVTLDIEMPGMSGLEFLDKLMRLNPLPVVMISGSTAENCDATITALTLGAVDCLLKPSNGADEAVMRHISKRVFSASCSQVQQSRKAQVTDRLRETMKLSKRTPLVLIGASTGGVAALGEVLNDLRPDGPPVVIVQHMPAKFLLSFAQVLNRDLPQDVAIAREAEPLMVGQIRLAPAMGQHTRIERQGGIWSCRLSDNIENALHCPSVDVLFNSAQDYATDIIATLLTGLGKDGANGMLALREGGAQTFGQDAATSVVYGMPRAAYEIGAVGKQLPLHKLGPAINRAVASHAKAKPGRAGS
ncbi:Chemotaxis response regulator protein-glutamate methylesterase [Sulfitobacter noctilucae]|uniref:chemotaxis-specific protein-glutamate methyltransferase CheB n=1 Tax=Sulfitobacter noctilucae TaxID=1342302 RepID=UPI00046A844B|nr:chemotaxis-specific protein-glutamate methyltransferase CheB [Sulfitobacter noctilucae]KIN61100.1 Chemotaxis response regulator protein-glutamate methylesterase [Sulfitobacter noctilucae]